MRVVVCACLLLASALAIGPVEAQTAEAPPLGPETNVLYLHSETGQDAWMNALEVDGAATNICYTDPEPTPIGDLCPNPGEAFEYVFDLMPGLPHDLLLDPSGTIDVEIYWGGACCTVGTADYDLSLTSGETVVASTSGSHTMNPGAVSSVCPNDGCVYNAVRESLTPEVDKILAADGLTLTLSGSGEWTHAAISTTAERGASTVSLPIVGTAGGEEGGVNATFVDLDEPAINVTQANATTALVQYNWTSPADTSAPLRLVADVQNGSLAVDVTVAAAGNATSGNATAEGSGNATADAGNGTAQTVFSWNGTGLLNETIEVGPCGDDGDPRPCHVAFIFRLDGFVGSYSLTFAGGVPLPEGAMAPPMAEGNGTAENGTLDSGADEDTPLPFLLVVAAVLLAASRRRR